MQGFGFHGVSLSKAPAPFLTLVQNFLLAANTASFWCSGDSSSVPEGQLASNGVEADGITGRPHFFHLPLMLI